MIVLLVTVVYFLIDSTLAGHVTIGHNAVLAGMVAASSVYASVGDHAML